MSDGSEKAQRWKDRGGTEWFVKRRRAGGGLKPGWVLRRVGYSFVAWSDDVETAPTAQQLQSWIESHTARSGGGAGTARLWTDPRNNTEWEVFEEKNTLVFQRGIEAVRTSRDYGALPPRSMSDEELKAALDRAQGG